MTYFTDSSFERMMQQVPHIQPIKPIAPVRGHPCQGCKRYGQRCTLPCYRGVKYKKK